MKISYFIGYCLVRALGLLPYRLLYALGYLLGLLYWQLGKRDRRIALTNIRLCFPELSAQEQTQLARNSLIHTCINFTETSWMWAHYFPAIKKKIITVEGHELLEAAEADAKGTVYVLGHFGQWDIFGAYLGQHCERPVYLGRAFGIPLLDNYVKRGRELSGGTIFPITREGISQLFQATADGRATGMLADQEPSRANGVFAPLFGQSALTTQLAQNLVKGTDAKVIMCACRRLPKGRGFHIRFFEADADIYNNDPIIASTALNRSYEQLIRWDIAQYNWSYKRFKTRPDGEAKVY